MRLRDKVAIITGAAQGIGEASARLFAREGARVVVADIQAELGAQVASAIRDAGGEAMFVQTDVSIEKQVSDLVDATCAEYGGIDILFNNAGIVIPKPLLETNENELDRLIQVNLKGAFFGIKYTLPVMIRRGGGSVINNTSSAAVTGRPGMSVYGASKGALLALTRGAAVAYGPSNVRFNAIVPGTIWTEMTESAFRIWSDVDVEKRRTEQVIPLRRVGLPEDIAYAALFLASDESRYVTGVAIPVDGGRTAGIAEAAKGED